MAQSAKRKAEAKATAREKKTHAHGFFFKRAPLGHLYCALGGYATLCLPPMASSRRRRSGTAKYGLSASREADTAAKQKRKEKKKKPPPGKSARGKMPSTNEAVKYLTKYTAIDNRAERNQPLLIPSAFFHPPGRCEKSHKTTILLSTPTQTHTHTRT